ncbi:MAG: biotin--[acetyl-CoA-carboxylase] ligase [Candidatus Bipolaricaulota bacterium]
MTTGDRPSRETMRHAGFSSSGCVDGLDSRLDEGSIPHWIFLDEVDSTNAYAARRLPEIPHGTFVMAAAQTAGRGRLGRRWHSPPVGNVYMSGVVKAFPAVPSAALPGALTMTMALAVCDAIEREGLAPTLKWPNDVLVDGRKVAGVLAQATYEGPRATAAVVGVGINVNMTAVELAAIDRPATSLAISTGRSLDASAIAQSVAARFLGRLAATRLDALRSEVLAKMTGIGDPIQVVGPQGTLFGTAVDLAEDLTLQVCDDRGCMHRISGGDVCAMG